MALLLVSLVIGVAGCAAALLGLHAAEWLASQVLGDVWGQ